MPKVSLANGYTKIANELLDITAKVKLTGTQFRIILAIWRYTYGFNRKSSQLSLTFLSEATKIKKNILKRELDKLIKFKVIIIEKDANFNSSRFLRFNKNYEEWDIQSIQSINMDTVSLQVDTIVPTQVDATVSPQVDQEIKKKNINKGPIDIFFEEIWKPYPHKKGKSDISDTQKKRLFDVGLEKMKRAIQKYADEVKNTELKYIMYGSTFFNGRYEDYLPIEAEPRKKGKLRILSDEDLADMTEEILPKMEKSNKESDTLYFDL